MPIEHPYRMTIDLNVLDHLADGLYIIVSAVITETVANSWDADATEVNIVLDIANDRIEISDNGIRMIAAASMITTCASAIAVGETRCPRAEAGQSWAAKALASCPLFHCRSHRDPHTADGGDVIGLRVISRESCVLQ